MAHVPLALLHEGSGPRPMLDGPHALDFLYASARIRLGEMLTKLVYGVLDAEVEGDASDRLTAVGSQLVELASDRSRLDHVLERVYVDSRTRLASHLERLVDRSGVAGPWRARVLGLRDAIVASLQTVPSPLIPIELLSHPDATATRSRFVGTFGRLLMAWGDIRDATHLLATRGQRLGREL